MAMLGRRGFFGGLAAMAAGWSGGDPGTGRGSGIRGGLPGPRSDQQYRPIGPQGPVGSSTGIVKARIVVVFGTGETGYFQYIGKPALGNPPEAWAVPPGIAVDPYGNSLPASGGFATQHIPGGLVTQIASGQVTVTNGASNAPGAMVAPGGSGGMMQLISPETGAADQQAVIDLFSKNGGLLGQPYARFFLTALLLDELGSAPATPTGAGALYVDATGHLTYKGPSGTVTILANP